MRRQPDVTYSMRTILVDWLVEVAEEYKLQSQTLYLTVSFIDRFLSLMSVVRSKLQLLGTAAMFVASYVQQFFPENLFYQSFRCSLIMWFEFCSQEIRRNHSPWRIRVCIYYWWNVHSEASSANGVPYFESFSIRHIRSHCHNVFESFFCAVWCSRKSIIFGDGK